MQQKLKFNLSLKTLKFGIISVMLLMVTVYQPCNGSECFGFGTGFFIDKNGYIATNHHVIDGANKITIHFKQNDEEFIYLAEVVAADKQNDLAILKIKDARNNSFEPFENIPYNFSTKDAIKGLEVFTIGFPKGVYEATPTKGNIIKVDIEEINVADIYTIRNPIEYDAMVDHGSSGGPLFDNEGNLVGVVQSGEGRKEFNYAVRSSVLKKFINTLNTPDYKFKLPNDITVKNLKYTDKIKILEQFVVFIVAEVAERSDEQVTVESNDLTYDSKTYNNGKYEGYFKNGKEYGRGTYTWNSGDKYTGDWIDGKRTGYGTYTWNNGNKYAGQYVDGEMTGYGTYTWNSGDKYTGDWIDGEMTGYGTYTWNSGDKYTGDWIDGKRTGIGFYVWKGNDKYVGQYVDGEMTGIGIYTITGDVDREIINCPRAKFYVCEYKNGKKSGVGTCYNSDGKLIYHGKFENDKPIEKYPTEKNYSSYKYEKLTFDSNNQYHGETKNGKCDGYGVYYFKDGGYMYSKWEDHKAKGSSLHIDKDGKMSIRD